MNEQQLQFLHAMLASDRVTAQEVLHRQCDETSSLEQVNLLIIPTLEEVGALWESGEVALSQVYMCGRICEELVDRLLPPKSPDRISQPKMGIATLDDYHFLGKRIVYSMLRASGYELQDYGRRTVDELIQIVRENGIRILLISTLMLPSALQVIDLKRGLKEAGHDEVRLIVGGAPFRLDRNLADEVGADAFGIDAAEAVSIISQTIG